MSVPFPILILLNGAGLGRYAGCHTASQVVEDPNTNPQFGHKSDGDRIENVPDNEHETLLVLWAMNFYQADRTKRHTLDGWTELRHYYSGVVVIYVIVIINMIIVIIGRECVHPATFLGPIPLLGYKRNMNAYKSRPSGTLSL